MKENPNKNWQLIREWVRPMNQLPAGLFWNITGVETKTIEDRVNWNGSVSEDLKLHMQWIDSGYIRIYFELKGEPF